MNRKYSLIAIPFALFFSMLLVFTTVTSINAQELNNTTNSQTFSNPTGMSMNQNLSMASAPYAADKEQSWTSSVSVFQPIVNAFKSLIKVDINQAVTSAENAVGTNATTIAAYLHPEKQYIVYNVLTLDSSGVAHKILVDPGNGNVLADKKMSFMELMKQVHGDGGMMGHDNNMMGGPEMGMGMMGHDNNMMGGPEMGMGMMGHDNGYNSWN